MTLSGYLVYHPKRRISSFGNIKTFHDRTRGNQDPYIWNERFLHTYCHITQMSPNIGDIVFWVSGDIFPDFSKLYCDLVFVISQKIYWSAPNAINMDDPIVDSMEAYNDHYQWAKFTHPFKRRRRFTLKADPNASFQPQDSNCELIDLVQFLIPGFYSLEVLRKGIRAGVGSRPVRLSSNSARLLFNWINDRAAIKLRGELLSTIRRQNPQLASPFPKTNL